MKIVQHRSVGLEVMRRIHNWELLSWNPKVYSIKLFLNKIHNVLPNFDSKFPHKLWKFSNFWSFIERNKVLRNNPLVSNMKWHLLVWKQTDKRPTIFNFFCRTLPSFCSTCPWNSLMIQWDLLNWLRRISTQKVN